MLRPKSTSKCITKNIFSLLIHFCIVCYNSGIVRAYPNVAGHCSPGGDLHSKSMNAHGEGGGDNIEDFDFEVVAQSIDTPSPIILDPSGSTFLVPDVRYTITLRAEKSARSGFKGFLFRLRGRGGEDASTALTVIPSMKSDSQELNFCGARASGISHTNNEMRTSMSIYFKIKEEGDFLLEVTVVQQNNPYPANGWGYSSYKLDLQKDSRDPTLLPTPSSTSDSPSNFPSDFPSSAPSESMSVMPGYFLYVFVWILSASFCPLLWR